MKQWECKLILLLFVILYFCQLVFCQDSFSFSSVENIVGKTFIFPKEENIKFINNVETKQDDNGKIVILVHYTGCTCELTDLNKWDNIIHAKEILEKKVPIFVVICNVSEYEDDVIINTIHNLNYDYDKCNLIIDNDLAFLKNNTVPSNTILNTYVLDNRNVIRYVGNPTIRKKGFTQFLLVINNLY